MCPGLYNVPYGNWSVATDPCSPHNNINILITIVIVIIIIIIIIIKMIIMNKWINNPIAYTVPKWPEL